MPDCAKTPVDLVRLWMHESERVYRDKLVDNGDMESYDKIKKEINKKSFEVRVNTLTCDCVFAHPLHS